MAEIVGTRAIALRLSEFRCPVEDCDGKLLRTSGELHSEPFTDYLGHHVPHPEVPKFHLGCDGNPMHVFDKMDLIQLSPRVLKTVAL
jgi:hypothetical protein